MGWVTRGVLCGFFEGQFLCAKMKQMSRRAPKSSEANRKNEMNVSAAIVSRRAADRLRGGHVWVYQSDIVEITGEAGSLLAVADQRGILLGTVLLRKLRCGWFQAS